MVRYQTCVLFITRVTNECTVMFLQRNSFRVCVVLFGFWSYCLKFYINLFCINTRLQTTTPFYLWFPSSQVSLLCCYYKSTVIRFVWYCFIIKVISIYPASTHYKEHQHHSTSHTWYNLATAKRRYSIRVQSIVVREITAPI